MTVSPLPSRSGRMSPTSIWCRAGRSSVFSLLRSATVLSRGCRVLTAVIVVRAGVLSLATRLSASPLPSEQMAAWGSQTKSPTPSPSQWYRRA